MKEEPRAAGPLDTAGLDPAVLDPAMAATSASTRKMPVDEESPRGPADPW
jgi:hypothetical protein